MPDARRQRPEGRRTDGGRRGLLLCWVGLSGGSEWYWRRCCAVYFLTEGELRGSQERSHQLPFTTDRHVGEPFEPFTRWHVRLFSQPI